MGGKGRGGTIFLHEWRDLLTSEAGPPGRVRLFLHFLSSWMDETGGSCFPSTRTLAERSGLTRRTVETLLREGEVLGWIERREKAGRGQGWRRHEYVASIPQKVEQNFPHLRGGRGEIRARNVGKSVQKGGAVLSPESPVSPQCERPHSLESEVEKAFKSIWAIYPPREGANSRSAAHREWKARVGEGVPPEEIEAGVQRYGAFIRSRGQEGSRWVMTAARFFGAEERGWEQPWEAPEEDVHWSERLDEPFVPGRG